MKTATTIIAMVLCTLGVAGAVETGARTFGDGALPAFLAVYDLDGDGVLSQEEKQAMRVARQERHQEWLDKWDLDGDGVISDSEREQARDRLREMIEECRTDRFNEADTDGDGYLSFEEFSAIPAVMALAERDPEKPAMLFDRLDADDDNLVSLDEFLAHLRERIRTRTEDPQKPAPEE